MLPNCDYVDPDLKKTEEPDAGRDTNIVAAEEENGLLDPSRPASPEKTCNTTAGTVMKSPPDGLCLRNDDTPFSLDTETQGKGFDAIFGTAADGSVDVPPASLNETERSDWWNTPSPVTPHSEMSYRPGAEVIAELNREEDLLSPKGTEGWTMDRTPSNYIGCGHESFLTTPGGGTELPPCNRNIGELTEMVETVEEYKGVRHGDYKAAMAYWLANVLAAGAPSTDSPVPSASSSPSKGRKRQSATASASAPSLKRSRRASSEGTGSVVRRKRPAADEHLDAPPKKASSTPSRFFSNCRPSKSSSGKRSAPESSQDDSSPPKRFMTSTPLDPSKSDMKHLASPELSSIRSHVAPMRSSSALDTGVLFNEDSSNEYDSRSPDISNTEISLDRTASDEEEFDLQTARELSPRPRPQGVRLQEPQPPQIALAPVSRPRPQGVRLQEPQPPQIALAPVSRLRPEGVRLQEPQPPQIALAPVSRPRPQGVRLQEPQPPQIALAPVSRPRPQGVRLQEPQPPQIALAPVSRPRPQGVRLQEPQPPQIALAPVSRPRPQGVRLQEPQPPQIALAPVPRLMVPAVLVVPLVMEKQRLQAKIDDDLNEIGKFLSTVSKDDFNRTYQLLDHITRIQRNRSTLRRLSRELPAQITMGKIEADYDKVSKKITDTIDTIKRLSETSAKKHTRKDSGPRRSERVQSRRR